MRTQARILLVATLSSVSCSERAPVSRADSAARAESPAAPACDAPGVRQVVEQLGGRMQRVSLLAPDSVVARELREVYAPLVTPDLLAAWLADPAGAPGRKVSSPWPDRIEIRSVEKADAGVCRVEGNVVYATSADTVARGEPLREPIRLSVRPDGAAWRISAYEVIATPSTGPTGAASRQSFQEFAGGFARTKRVQVEVGEPGRVEGTYVLRRRVVDGASGV